VAVEHNSDLREVCWHIVPLDTPRVVRHCARCRELRRFASSDRFRLNAQQRKVDVWLVYKCTVCEDTWNCTIVTRRTPEEIGQDLYQRFQHNDHGLAWSYAFDFALLSRLGVRVDPVVRVGVERPTANGEGVFARPQKISLRLVYPCSLRLDRLLAEELRVSRSCVQRWFECGLLQVQPEEEHALRKPIRNGQTVLLLADGHTVWSPHTSNG
jgi:hypothetical protein